ncbi:MULTISPECIES: hypothetical protein [unclassified Acinetobacter]|uniref:hypothetical protein n=1 Tax=unclassified Acinetobacter TaxID=196816 RepID=UPI00244899B9|nr:MULTISPECIES: hypothetical protein [unclassified Acinetobacter]MDH0031131.1 hypothetical protein [Acinetobacter sp. GD04021]MDH0886717.1 hypothetical protein [Acinetobacter sp. GD03873]MDH1083150.1 hypothetical protein [Acinetobacter sp. GD03983]MDH2189337.1 hypothetical protein [Acinetobacter sp. GD03645]MDH2202856.1 hypothetical protein [Acinetobacter sp. GD03647]
MATYELYLWEPEVDLSNQEWNETLQYIDQHDPVTIKTVIRQKIYKNFKDKEHTASHIVTFFNCILEILNKPEYQAYFEGLLDWIIEQQGYFNKSPRLVFQDEDTLANATSNEFKRALYEAIEQSGVCAYETMNGYLLPSDSIARKSIFKEIFNAYPVLVPQVPRPSVTLGTTPQNVTEMKDMLLAFMQHHPVGSQFEVEKIVKEFNSNEQYYSIMFKKDFIRLSHNFKISLNYNKRRSVFSLGIGLYNWVIVNEYLDQEEKKFFESNKLIRLNGVDIKNVFDILFLVSGLKSISCFSKKKEITSFEFKNNEFFLFENFLFQLGDVLNILGSIKSIYDLVDLFFYSNELVDGGVNNILNGVASKNIKGGGGVLFLLRIALYGNMEEKYIKNISKVVINYFEGREDEMKKTVEEEIKIANAVKEHVKQRVSRTEIS